MGGGISSRTLEAIAFKSELIKWHLYTEREREREEGRRREEGREYKTENS